MPTIIFFWLAHAGPQIFQKKSCLFLSLKSVPHKPLKRACMGDGPAAHGWYLHDCAWSCIPEHAASSVDFIAELKSAIEELSKLLDHPPSCRDPDEVRACRHSPPLTAISIWLMARQFMSHSPLGRLSLTGSTTIAPSLLKSANISAPICSAMSLHAKPNADLLCVFRKTSLAYSSDQQAQAR